MLIVMLVSQLLLFPLARYGSDSQSCSVFLLKTVGSKPSVEKLILSDGDTAEFDMTPSSGYITVLLPFGVGQSGEVVQSAKPKAKAVVHCDGGFIRTIYYRDDGTEHSMPAITVEDMASHNMRVNVTTADGPQAAFLIRAGSVVDRADGPVIDMFRGLIPLEEGDYSVTVETTVYEEPAAVRGSAPVIFDGNHFFVEGSLPGGPTGKFIVDFGAGSTVLARNALPDDAQIDALIGIEHSEEGSRTVAGVAGGLGGSVESFLGRSTVAELTFGTVSFEDVRVGVVSGMPDIGGMQPIGILGLDLLDRAPVVSLSYRTEDAGNAATEIEWRDAARTNSSDAVDVPFSIASNHMFIEGSIASNDADFVFDTGARVSIISRDLAIQTGLSLVEGSERELRGLDGNAVGVELRQADEVVLGDQRFRDLSFHAGQIDVLEAWGLGESGAILGNDFLQRFQRVEIDFGRSLILFVE
jgi:predicted aspartyl protease